MPQTDPPSEVDGALKADGGGAAASQSAIPQHEQWLTVEGNLLPATEYRRSIKVDWSKVIDRKVPRGTATKRGRIGDMTPRSGQRLLFGLNNAPCDWGVMFTATFRERVMDGRPVLAEFQRGMRRDGFGDVQYAWVREYQGRGAVHYHFLWEREALERRGFLAASWLQSVRRKNSVRQLVRGPFENIVVNNWLRAVADLSPEFAAFQWGGVVELLGEADSAARYFGSYMGKEEQKQLPDDAEKSGRWWFICPRSKPLEVSRGHLKAWNKPLPLSCVFDKFELTESYTLEPRSVVRDPKLMRYLRQH